MAERLITHAEHMRVEAENQPRHCIVIPGIQATYKGMFGPLGIHKAFVQQYGEGNVTTFSSSISADKPTRQHFDEIAEAIMTQARKGPLDVAMFSLGSTEFALPIYKRILKKDKHFFDDPHVKENLRFHIKSGSGFSKGTGRVTYPIEFVRLLRDVGLDTIYAFPPEDMSSTDIRTLYSRRPNNGSSYGTVSFVEHENVRSNSEFLTQKEREAKIRSEEEIRAAKSHMQYRRARRLIRKRKKVLNPPLQAVFEGTTERSGKKQRVKLGGVRGAALLVRAVGSKPERRFKKLHNKGYEVYHIVSGLERLVTTKQVEKLYKNKYEAKKYIRVLQDATHAGDALQAGILAKTIYELGDRAA